MKSEGNFIDVISFMILFGGGDINMDGIRYLWDLLVLDEG